MNYFNVRMIDDEDFAFEAGYFHFLYEKSGLLNFFIN